MRSNGNSFLDELEIDIQNIKSGRMTPKEARIRAREVAAKLRALEKKLDALKKGTPLPPRQS
jgi:hypothetical protein